MVWSFFAILPLNQTQLCRYIWFYTWWIYLLRQIFLYKKYNKIDQVWPLEVTNLLAVLSSIFYQWSVSNFYHVKSWFFMQVLFKCYFQHTQQKSLQLFSISIVSYFDQLLSIADCIHFSSSEALDLHPFYSFFASLFCSFVSVIHLLVGVVYCLVSWAVGLPKRAVSFQILPLCTLLQR